MGGGGGEPSAHALDDPAGGTSGWVGEEGLDDPAGGTGGWVGEEGQDVVRAGAEPGLGAKLRRGGGRRLQHHPCRSTGAARAPLPSPTPPPWLAHPQQPQRPRAPHAPAARGAAPPHRRTHISECLGDHFPCHLCQLSPLWLASAWLSSPARLAALLASCSAPSRSPSCGCGWQGMGGGGCAQGWAPFLRIWFLGAVSAVLGFVVPVRVTNRPTPRGTHACTPPRLPPQAPTLPSFTSRLARRSVDCATMSCRPNSCACAWAAWQVSEPRHRLSPDTGKQGEAAPQCLRSAAAQTAARVRGQRGK